ncbi:MAG: transketolase [Nanoarchaeota archaeon]|nr:transketolase [Nanoarchaeota archaeon]MBU1320880.1 transketolase [Nanoarchaeota archaeon]MBU1597786.1 transketolase [Nanoarchaeota archaeon]MBU2441237.1 transketolase [Nanoarchaeota archaeon]
MRKTALNEVFELAKKHKKVFFIGSDLGAGTLNDFREQIPERFLLEGIYEQNIIGMAAGLALEGKVVYINSIATFLTRRCFDQNILDLGLHNVNVRIIANGGGLVYAPLGPTHEAIEDIAIMKTIPNMTVIAPADAQEMKKLIPLTLEYKGPIYIRMGKGYDPIVTDKETPFVIGKAYPMRKGSDALILTTGITLRLALEAADELAKYGIKTSVIHVPTIKPLDKKTILKHAEKIHIIVTVEEHIKIGGFGSAISELLCEANFAKPKKFKMIGIPDEFPENYGSQDLLMEHYGISTKGLVKAVKDLKGK